MFASFFFTGYFPLFPGTVGSAAALPFYMLVSGLHPLSYLLLAAALTIVAIFVSDRAEKSFGSKDPKKVVIDEVAGMLITMTAVSPTIGHMITGFIIFRVLDIIKPYPAGLMEKIKGGAGIVLDDVVSGIYSCIILHFIIKQFGF
ncbi:MAG: hypothetical protein A2X49_00225 [Lentisphaerae bacterium GWF2_52_8]|nr:MAG: hypothetical protein A2X49_00225 [Lentisphaerae bacterium GWF2_52_8]